MIPLFEHPLTMQEEYIVVEAAQFDIEYHTTIRYPEKRNTEKVKSWIPA